MPLCSPLFSLVPIAQCVYPFVEMFCEYAPFVFVCAYSRNRKNGVSCVLLFMQQDEMLDLPNAFDDARVFWLVSAVEHNVHTRIVFNAEILSDDFFPASSSLAFTRNQAFLFTVFFVVLLDEFIGKANKVVFSPLPQKQ